MKKLRKLPFVIVMVIALVFTIAPAVHASWYGYTSATFSASVTGVSRHYEGNNVGLTWGPGTHNSDPDHISNSNGFFIELQRKAFIGWTTIGTVNVPRNGTGSASWTNVGSGDYRFNFYKSIDGTTEYVEGIEMYSW